MRHGGNVRSGSGNWIGYWRSPSGYIFGSRGSDLFPPASLRSNKIIRPVHGQLNTLHGIRDLCVE